ncbi:MAG: nitronate monooxygenase [Pseudomonadota bacterium]
MIDTAFTRTFGLKHAIALAPELGLAPGPLAAAVADAGGLGLIGCGENNAGWIAEEFSKTGDVAVGCGLSCRALEANPARLEAALRGRPRAVYLHDGDPRPHAAKLHVARVRMICEVQTLDDAKRAVAADAHVIVARGADAGGQPAPRTMFNLVPELAAFIRQEADDMILLAYGGVIDARTLAAVLTLGADGAMMSTRLIESAEGMALQGPRSQGMAMVQDKPPVTEILTRITAQAEKVITHSKRAVIP